MGADILNKTKNNQDDEGFPIMSVEEQVRSWKYVIYNRKT